MNYRDNKRITASRVGGRQKVKMTRRSRKVEEILYSKFRGSQAAVYGTNMEDTARQQYVAYQHQKGHAGLRTSRVSLVISVESLWLAASPDNKVYDPSTD